MALSSGVGMPWTNRARYPLAMWLQSNLLLEGTLHEHGVLWNYFCPSVNVLIALPMEHLRLFRFPTYIRKGFLWGRGFVHMLCTRIWPSTIVEWQSKWGWILHRCKNHREFKIRGRLLFLSKGKRRWPKRSKYRGIFGRYYCTKQRFLVSCS